MADFRFFQMYRLPVFAAILLCGAGLLYAAPLESGFSHAPSAVASSAEKADAYRDARLRVIAAAEQYLRTPYRYGGMDKWGMDCSGLVHVSFRDALEVTIPRNTSGLYSWVEQIQIQNASPGDLVFFVTAGSTVSHVGIYLGNRRFIHAASAGPVTGVMYSTLDESYWSRTYLGAGRALPPGAISGNADGSHAAAENTAKAVREKKTREKISREQSAGTGRILFGVAAAPTWKTTFIEGPVVRGVAGQMRLGAEVKPFGLSMIFGLELRPEWDRTLDVMRFPLTLSWGPSDKFRIFGGPVLSFGDASLSVDGKSRSYTGGTTWFGAAGISIAPFVIKIAKTGSLFPYAELAWQSYTYNGDEKNTGADFNAGFRFSTGLCYTWRK